MTFSTLIRPVIAMCLLVALTPAGAIAKGKDRTPRSCAQMQAMMDHGMTGGKHAGDEPSQKRKLEKKMRKKGCMA